LSLKKCGFWGVMKSLSSFNSCYNFRQNWLFARRYAKVPLVYIICRYTILFINENFRRIKAVN
jgi:hypothetical protein